MERISRKRATELGATSYFTGKPCHNGHISSRITDNGTCRECHKLFRKNSYENNKLHHSEVNKVYYEDNKEVMDLYRKTWCEKNPYKVWFRSAKSKKRDSNFTLTWEEVEAKLINQDYKCLLTGLPFWSERNAGLSGMRWDSPSMDRLICGGDYSNENVRIILQCVNVFRGYTTDDNMRLVVDKLKLGSLYKRKFQHERLR